MLGRAEQLNLPQGFFDLVFCVDVIHHLTDCAAYFREAYRVLKPGGKVCTVTESRDLIRNRSLHSVYFPETVEIDLARYPRMADLREWMECADFVTIAEEEAAFAYRRYDMQALRGATDARSPQRQVPPRVGRVRSGNHYLAATHCRECNRMIANFEEHGGYLS